MTPEPGTHGLEIGVALKDARRRIGMDVAEAEEQTKIRAKYLRALEAEDWEVLPAPAYVRGFLRTYGALLGLDGETLADEYRRRYEAPAGPTSPASEPFLKARQGGRQRGNGSGPPSRGPLIAGVAGVIVVLVLLLSLLGGDDEPTTTSPTGLQGSGKGGKQAGKGGGGSDSKPREPIDIRIEALGTVQVCVASSGDALLDDQLLAEGVTEKFGGEKRYRIDLPDGGAVKVDAGDASEKLEAGEAASWEANSNGISGIDYAGPDCP